MKKLALFIFLAAFSFSSFSQRRSQKLPMDIGIFYLPQLTGITNSISYHSDPIYKNKITFAGGAGLNLTFWKSSTLGFQIGAMYISHNQKFTSELIEGDPSSSNYRYRKVTGKRRLDYVEVPLLLVFNNKLHKSRISLYSFIGPQLAYLIKGDGGVVIFHHYSNASDFYDLPVSGNKYYNQFLLGVVGGAGMNLVLTPQISLSGAIRADYGITNTEKKNAMVSYPDGNRPLYTFGDSNRKSAHNFSIGLQIGLVYHVGGKGHLLQPSNKYY